MLCKISGRRRRSQGARAAAGDLRSPRRDGSRASLSSSPRAPLRVLGPPRVCSSRPMGMAATSPRHVLSSAPAMSCVLLVGLLQPLLSPARVAVDSTGAAGRGRHQRCPGGAGLERRYAAGANSMAGCRWKRAEWGLHGKKLRANEDEQYRLKVEEETTFVQSRSSS